MHLQVFKTNPAIDLYKRLGFETVDETRTHCIMERKPYGICIRSATLNDVRAIQKLNYELFKLEKENYDSTLIVDWPL